MASRRCAFCSTEVGLHPTLPTCFECGRAIGRFVETASVNRIQEYWAVSSEFGTARERALAHPANGDDPSQEAVVLGSLAIGLNRTGKNDDAVAIAICSLRLPVGAALHFHEAALRVLLNDALKDGVSMAGLPKMKEERAGGETSTEESIQRTSEKVCTSCGTGRLLHYRFSYCIDCGRRLAQFIRTAEVPEIQRFWTVSYAFDSARTAALAPSTTWRDPEEVIAIRGALAVGLCSIGRFDEGVAAAMATLLLPSVAVTHRYDAALDVLLDRAKLRHIPLVDLPLADPISGIDQPVPESIAGDESEEEPKDRDEGDGGDA